MVGTLFNKLSISPLMLPLLRREAILSEKVGSWRMSPLLCDASCPVVASSIKDLFDTIEAHKIIDFIKETRFYKQL